MEQQAPYAADVVSAELEKYRAAGGNLMMPSTLITGLSEFHRPVIETVYLSANPAEGDVYPHDDVKESPKKKWRPTKQALMKLSVCAGVIWSTNESRRIDNGADRNYIAYRAVGGVRKADGQPVFFSADYDLDFEVMEEELRELYEKKTKAEWMKDKNAAQKAEYVDFCVKRDLLQKRKNRLKLCEAGAMNRVLRMLLGIKQAYTTEELKKPFVTMRITFAPDFTDRDVRNQFISASIKAMTGIFGPGALDNEIHRAQPQPIDVTAMDDDEKMQGGEDNGTTQDGYAMTHPTESLPEEPKAAPPAAPPASPLSPFENAVLDFKNSDEFSQCQTLTHLANAKKYNIVDYLNRTKVADLVKLGVGKRASLFAHLLTLPDPPDAPPPAPQQGKAINDDDIPF
jgi:hypothetical protein